MLIAKYRKPARNRLNQCVVCNKDFQRGLPAWLLAWSWQPAPTNEDRIQRREDLRTVPNKRQHAAINTNDMISPQRPRKMYTINLPHRFGLCRENVSLALKIYFLPAQIPTRNLRGAYRHLQPMPPVWFCTARLPAGCPVCRAEILDRPLSISNAHACVIAALVTCHVYGNL